MTDDRAHAASTWRARCLIDHEALIHNFDVLRRAAGDADVWPVIKANAYGHGAVAVAKSLQAAGAARMCVVAASELAELRQAGIDTPLLVMGPLQTEGLAEAMGLGAEVTVTHPEQLQAIVAAARGTQVKVHLKVDTGMGRWGIPAAETLATARMLSEADGVDVVGLMTHFATADEADDAFLHEQARVFSELVGPVRELAPGVTIHASNSAATLRFPEYSFEAVRCGVALYGMDPMQADPAQHDLRPVMSVHSVVASIRHLDAGQSSGYARRFRPTQPARVALVPIGYADGIRRLLSGRGRVAIDGRSFPIVGTVSMDHVSVLVDGSVAAGAQVTLIGQDGGATVRAEDHAAWAGTINYEITCGMAREPRLARVHTGDGAADHLDSQRDSRPGARH